MNKHVRLIIFSLALSVLLGCSQQGSQQSENNTRKYEDLTAQQHKELLYKRILGVWDAMVKQDYAKQYSYYDPFMKTRVLKEDFIKGRNAKFHYYNPELKNVVLNGRIADVGVAVDVEIVQMKIAGGRTYDLPRNRRVIKERWLWMDGNWVREYKNSKSSFVSY